MLENILNLLKADDYYGKSELIDFAKGGNEFTLNYKKKKEQIKRKRAWRLKEQ